MPSTEIYTLSLHDALPIYLDTEKVRRGDGVPCAFRNVFHGSAFPRNGAGRSEEHTSELQSLRHLVCRPPRSTLFPYTTLFRSTSTLKKSAAAMASHAPSGTSSMAAPFLATVPADRKSTRLNSSHLGISYAVHRDLHSFPTRRSSDLPRH